MVMVRKFSQFITANLTLSDNTLVGLSGGSNAISAKIVSWSTAGRPSPPVNGIIGYNTDDQLYEYYDSTLAAWRQLSDSTGTITQIDTGVGLTGGPITSTGTISLIVPVTVDHGGTGDTSFTAYSVICGGTTSTGALQNVSGVGTADQVLSSNGPGTLPSWKSVPIFNPQALTEVNDTNVTMTLGGTPATALLQAVSMTLGWTGQLAVARGGTGDSSFTPYAVICGGTTSTAALQNVSGVGSANQVLVSNGAGALPSWQSVPGVVPAALTKTDDTNVTLTLGGSPTVALLAATSLTLGWTGQLVVSRGGTGDSSFTAYAVICGGTTSTDPLQSIASVGTNGQVLTSNGAGALPTFQSVGGSGTVNSGTANQLAYYATTGTAVSGLTGANSAVLVSTVAGVPIWTSSLTDGQVILGVSGGTPVAASISAGPGISITPGAGTLTISASASGIAWSTIVGTTQAATVNNGYIVGNAGQTTITLPTTFAIGEVVIIKGLGAAGWILKAGTSTTIQIGQTATSSGGTLTSAGNYDTVYVTGLVANTTWSVDYTFSTGLTVA